MNWKLAIAGLIIIPFFAFPTRKVGKVHWKITQVKLQELNQIVQETLSISGSTLKKIFNREPNKYKKFTNLSKDVSKLQIKSLFKTREEAKAAIFWYIEIYYRRKRPHAANGYKTPEVYTKVATNFLSSITLYSTSKIFKLTEC